MATKAAQTSNSTNLAQTVQNVPTPLSKEAHKELANEAAKAIEGFLAYGRKGDTPAHILRYLFSIQYIEGDGTVKYFDSEVDHFHWLVKDIKRILIDPHVSKALMKLHNKPNYVAERLDRLCDFFDALNEEFPQAHLRLYDIKNDPDDYTEDELRRVIRGYTEDTAIEQARAQARARR